MKTRHDFVLMFRLEKDILTEFSFEIKRNRYCGSEGTKNKSLGIVFNILNVIIGIFIITGRICRP